MALVWIKVTAKANQYKQLTHGMWMLHARLFAKHFMSLRHYVIGFSRHSYKKGANYFLCTDEERELIRLPKITPFVQGRNAILARPILVQALRTYTI